MNAFDFGQIGSIMSELFDSDLIDIKRDVSGSLQEIYSNIPCHIAFVSIDNPDPKSVDTKPIIQSLNIHCALWVDIQNNDYIVAKRMNNSGDLLKVYNGRCGNPIVSEGRKKVLVTMSTTDDEDSTPVPPKNPITIKINYISNNDLIQDSIEKIVGENESFSMAAPFIEGFVIDSCVIDGQEQQSNVAYIENVGNSNHVIDFIYLMLSVPNIMRFLVNGLYTKDDGSLATGYHLYKKINIDSILQDGDSFTITCDDVKWIHDDNQKSLEIGIGTKLVLIPGNVFVQVDDVIDVSNGKITFSSERFIPTDEEKKSYVAGWYD